MTVGGKVKYSLDEFKAAFPPGDVIEFYYLESGGTKRRIFGIITGYFDPGDKYRHGGVDFYYYRLDEKSYESLASLRIGDIGIDEIYEPHIIDDNLLLVEI